MSVLTPKRLFDEGLVRRIDFNDEDCIEYRPGAALRNPESSSPSDDDRLDCSTDSAVADVSCSSLRCHSDVRMSSPSGGSSPPYRKIRALRLFGLPQSPKTLLKQSELNSAELRNRVLPLLQTTRQDSPFSDCENDAGVIRRRNARPLNTPKLNPFTPSEMCLSSKIKRRRLNKVLGDSLNCTFDDIVDENDNPEEEVLSLLLSATKTQGENKMSRYENEFFELSQIGYGEFGSVYRCINKLDRCEYALKKSRRPIKGTANERRALNEVYAHAILGQHTHVVRYYSAWDENDHMLIQNEYCNGGSLAEAIEERRNSGVAFLERNVKQILLHIALGLRYIHSLHLAHMDIKPGNIFIKRRPKMSDVSLRVGDSPDDGFEDDEIGEEEVIFKIGDLGHVTSTSNPEVEEGDCRYMAAELLQDDYSHLQKADIFSLGLTIFEVCGGGPLQKNGSDWHAIREGNLPYLSNYSKDLNKLLMQMTHPNPELRPTSGALAQHKTLVPYSNMTRAQLHKELSEEKYKNQLLSKQLAEASQSLKKYSVKEKIFNKGKMNISSRLIGAKYNRSYSASDF